MNFFITLGPEIRPFLSINARITSKGDNFDQELFIFLLIRIIYDFLEESEIQQILFLSAILIYLLDKQILFC